MKIPFAVYMQNLWIPLAVLLPNMFFLFFKPRNIPETKVQKTTNKIFEICERIGQIGIFMFPIFSWFQLNNNFDFITFVLMTVCLIFYYICWIRYFIKGRDYSFLFNPFIGIPIPLALSPVLYFICAAFIEKSVLLFVFTVLFSVGHIPISYSSYLNYKNKI